MGFSAFIPLIFLTWINILYHASCYDQLVKPGYTRASSSSVAFGGYPNKTVDGNMNQSHFTHCMHTAPGHKEAWLRIDLRKIYNIHSVKFWYRNDFKGYNTRRIQGFNIRISNNKTGSQNICYQDDGNTTLPPIIEKGCEGVAQYVWIYTNKMLPAGVFLEICEVQVYGCSYKDSSGNCISCEQCKNDCNINGECDGRGCKNINYPPPYCKECREGFYGRNCNISCGYCAMKAACDYVNGSCPFGYCEPGWKNTRDRRCDEACSDGWYGRECEERCGYCRGNKPCHHVTGSCSGLCEPGYHGDKCEDNVFSKHLANQREMIKLISELLAYKRRKVELRENGTSPTDFK